MHYDAQCYHTWPPLTILLYHNTSPDLGRSYTTQKMWVMVVDSGGFYLVKRTSLVLARSKVMGSSGYIFMIIRGVPGQDDKHPPPLRLYSLSPCRVDSP